MRRLRAVDGAYASLFLLLTVASCNCEERIRDAVSRDNVKKSFDDAGESSQPTEEEPNDALEQATLLRLGGELRPAVGAVERPGDVDWYSLRTDSGESWLLNVEVVPRSDAFDPKVELEVEPSQPKRVVYDAGEAGAAETIRHLGVSDEVQRIGISGGDGTHGPYRIVFSRQLSAGAIEREPNDLREAATNFEFPGEIQGFYGREEDVDWFHVVRADASPGIYRLSVSATGSSPQSVAIYTGRDAERPYVSLQVPPDEDLEVPNLRIPRRIDGIWYRLSAEGGTGEQGGYELRAVAHPESEDYAIEAEPNDELSRGTEMSLGGRMRGYLHTPSDLDHIRIAVGRPVPSEVGDAGLPSAEEDAGTSEEDTSDQADAGRGTGYVAPVERLKEKEKPSHVVQVGLKPLSENDRLTLLWWRDGPGGSPRTIEASAPGEAVKLCNHPIDRGLMEVGVRGAKLKQREIQGGFTYEIAALDIVSEVEGLEIEPNDTRENADVIELGTARTGYIARRKDRDLFGFGVPDPRRGGSKAESPDSSRRGRASGRDSEPPGGEGSSEGERRRGSAPSTGVRIELQSSELDLGFQVLDAEGAPVAEIDRSGAGADESTEIDLPPGLYYVRVESERGAVCKPYELRVSRSEPAGAR